MTSTRCPVIHRTYINRENTMSCLKCPFAETEPVWEVKQGVRFIFEGEGGVPPDRLGSHGVFSCPGFQSFHYVNLKPFFPQLDPIKSQKSNSTHIHPVALSSHGGDGPVQASLHLPLQKRLAAVNGHHILHPS